MTTDDTTKFIEECEAVEAKAEGSSKVIIKDYVTSHDVVDFMLSNWNRLAALAKRGVEMEKRVECMEDEIDSLRSTLHTVEQNAWHLLSEEEKTLRIKDAIK